MDIVDELQKEEDRLSDKANLLERAAREIEDLREELEAAHDRHAEEMESAKLDSYRSMVPGIYHVHENGFTCVGDTGPWTEEELSAWANLAPHVEEIAHEIVNARGGGWSAMAVAQVVAETLVRRLAGGGDD